MPWSLKPFANLLPWCRGTHHRADLYDAIMAQARLPIYYQRLGVPDTLEGRFAVLTLHLFAVLRRLKGAGPEAAATAQTLSDRFVSDMDTVLREVGVGDLSVPKKVRNLVATGANRIESYDRSVSAGGDEFEAAIAEGLPLDDEAARAVGARFTPYINALLQDLDAQPIEELCAGRLHFPDIPEE